MEFPQNIIALNPTEIGRIYLDPDTEIASRKRQLNSFDTYKKMHFAFFSLFALISVGSIALLPLTKLAKAKALVLSIALLYLGKRGLFTPSYNYLVKLQQMAHARIQPQIQFLNAIHHEIAQFEDASLESLFGGLGILKNMPQVSDPRKQFVLKVLLAQARLYEKRAEWAHEWIKGNIIHGSSSSDEQPISKMDYRKAYSTLNNRGLHPANNGEALKQRIRELDTGWRNQVKEYFIARVQAAYCLYVCKRAVFEEHLDHIYLPEIKFPQRMPWDANEPWLKDNELSYPQFGSMESLKYPADSPVSTESQKFATTFFENAFSSESSSFNGMLEIFDFVITSPEKAFQIR